jgi:hypothetical protein
MVQPESLLLVMIATVGIIIGIFQMLYVAKNQEAVNK